MACSACGEPVGANAKLQAENEKLKKDLLYHQKSCAKTHLDDEVERHKVVAENKRLRAALTEIGDIIALDDDSENYLNSIRQIVRVLDKTIYKNKGEE